MTQKELLDEFWNVVLRGESKTYNDHNWYVTGGKLRGYIEGRNQSPYPLLKKPLSEYTIGEVMAFQSRSRDANGQLWATGRYQIIPSTLKGLYEKAGLKTSDLYNKENQDKLGWQLMLNRKNLRNYIKGTSADSTENLEKASLDMAMIWSSIGVPYAMKGHKKPIDKNESYYSGGGDKASVKTEDVQNALRKVRQTLLGKIEEVITETKEKVKKNPLITILAISVTTFAGFVLINYLKKKK